MKKSEYIAARQAYWAELRASDGPIAEQVNRDVAAVEATGTEWDEEEDEGREEIKSLSLDPRNGVLLAHYADRQVKIGYIYDTHREQGEEILARFNAGNSSSRTLSFPASDLAVVRNMLRAVSIMTEKAKEKIERIEHGR